MTNIIWFRSDLRTLDNQALNAALSHDRTKTVRAVFYVSETQWLNHGWGPNKIGFVLQHVLSLRQNLAKLNVQLDIEYCDEFKNIPEHLLNYLVKHKSKNLFYNHEYELNETLRDQTVTRISQQHNIQVYTFQSQTLIRPGIILTKLLTPYSIFTPFKKACYEYLFRNLPAPIEPPKTAAKSPIVLQAINPKFQKYINNSILKNWKTGQAHALQILDEFCEQDIQHYQQQRDFPNLNATSGLSAYLAVGAISVKQCFIAAITSNKHEFATGNEGIVCWISELIWRDFYKHIIYHYPELCMGQNFNHKYDKLDWQNPQPHLQLWQNGQTGVPIIDAAMRQLLTTGWMHNRLRMVVAMFLTKNLLIDWRHGEKFFSQHLVDLDFASNNGGWQWSASTGTDAVPYFRIFNPIAQSQKFDKDGIFIKKYCPELKTLSSTQIHDPSSSMTKQDLANINYPNVIVDIAKSRLRALKRFKEL